MEITFTKGENRAYTTTALRTDGVLLSVPNSDRKSALPHDIAHYVVEKGLALKRGFWGRTALGAVYPGMKVLSGRQPPHAAERSHEIIRTEEQQGTEAEVLVGLLARLIEDRQDTDDTAIRSMLKEAWRSNRPERTLPEVEEVKRVCAELRAALEQWQALEPGHSLTFTWSLDQHSKRHAPKNRNA